MTTNTLLEVLQAAHWSYLVQSEWQERGGIMLVAPPAALKTTLMMALDLHHDALILSDINVSTLMRLRDDIAAGRYRTIVFPEFEKIYQRNPQTAMNIEGIIKSLVEEGFRSASFEDARTPGTPARCMVVGGITPSFMRKSYNRWKESGFARRFLWSTYQLEGPIIADAIEVWKKADLDGMSIIQMRNKIVPYELTRAEAARIRNLIKYQAGQETPFVLLQKIACILRQKDKATKENTAMRTVTEFAASLTDAGTTLKISGGHA